MVCFIVSCWSGVARMLPLEAPSVSELLPQLLDAKALMAELAERAGHSKPSMSVDVYTHVMRVAEVAKGQIRALIAA